jgi:hypothetical protein
MIGRNGDNVETMRELISISEEERSEMTEWAQNQPEMVLRIEAAIRFRAEVLFEFNRLLSEGNMQANPERGMGVKST